MTEVVQQLNELLEAERAGVETAAQLSHEASDESLRTFLQRLRADESWSCAGLWRAIENLGGVPSRSKGDFAAKVAKQPTMRARLELLNRGQAWVVRRLDSLLAADLPAEVKEFLLEMRRRHVVNIEDCARLVADHADDLLPDRQVEPGALYRFLAADHARLDSLLQKAVAGGKDSPEYSQFRAGLLKHIAMEEKILLPEVQRRRGGEPLAVAARLRLEHGAIAALLVPPLSDAIVEALRTVLRAHNALEEGAGGLYEQCEAILRGELDGMVARLQGMAEVRVSAPVDNPKVRAAARRALERAGFHEVAARLDG
jgi:hypothetical protein